ncbi:LysR family transcriptional regulator [Laceyella sacchari]|uniref:LysR family transcriptional regulator n=1 Tax=Laceyella sacchari TaxID=37482 RepID=A0ABY5U511_LACSH|nr:LysR family transcriptional regulator [Laceyella sacchari]AUS08482.1 LysR family transcriptional regulator [Laceyella sacchari]KPC77779.1 transcriptional regulator [Thermoactinomyces vulgaris]MRG29221.1 LysR family transcriptional regulator [Laceyella tengchongensis]UWE04732.1 LysR family transcriptional regulator [Laceyella sacchari]
MEMRQLKTFKAVAERGGFTRAAEELGYAQSSVTAQIQALEEELDTLLFDRLGKRIVLTEAGKRLLVYATELLRMHDEAIDRVRSYAEPRGKLTIGSPESIAAFRLTDVILTYKRKYPQVNLVVKPGLCLEMSHLVRSGEIDVAFTMLQKPLVEPDMHLETLVWEKMALVAAPDHPLARLERVEASDLIDQSFLHTEAGCSYRSSFELALRKHGVVPKGEEFWSIEAIKNGVYAGLGIALLPMITVREELLSGKLVRLNWDDQECRVCTQMIYHRDKWLSPALKAWIDLVRQRAQSWGGEG